MLNRRYFPYERNNYYFGKLLTAKDFQSEQKYFNDKRRLGNILSGANGVVAGLGVVVADDTAIILQSGCAMDASGREIVVPETRVIKLSTIEGYADITSSCAYLGIRYDEKPVQEVYTPLQKTDADDSSANYGAIEEGYSLYLLDESMVNKEAAPEQKHLAETVLYSDSEITITQTMPNFVPRGRNVAVFVTVTKRAGGKAEYSFALDMNLSGFTAEDGDDKIHLEANNLKLSQGEKVVYRYILSPKPHIWSSGAVCVVKTENLVIKTGKDNFSIKESFETVLKSVEDGLLDHYVKSYYQESMDKKLLDHYDDRLWLARIDLFRQNLSVLIDKVSVVPFAQYTYNPQQLMNIRRIEEYLPDVSAASGLGGALSGGLHYTQSVTPESFDSISRNTACGTFDIGLGLAYSTKEPVFSEEIMHGLGKGPVYVEVGVEYIIAGKSTKEESREIFLGDISIFGKTEKSGIDERIFDVSTAVKVLPERGTFIVGVQPKETSGVVGLTIRWYAMRLSEVSKQIASDDGGGKYILVNPDTIIVQPKGTAHILPVFINMPTEACEFILMDENGGTVDNNGVYIAPAKEGVYEIRVQAISDPSIYTTVFAIVTQKKKI